MFYLFAVILGFAYGGLAAIESPLVAELFGLSSHGVIMGVASFGYAVGGAVGPVMAGRIFDIFNSYQIAFLVCAVVCVLGIILACRLRPPTSAGGEGDPTRSAGLYQDSIRVNISNKNRLKHMVAVGAVVQASARRFGEDEKERKLPKYFPGVTHVVSQDKSLTDRASCIRLTSQYAYFSKQKRGHLDLA